MKYAFWQIELEGKAKPLTAFTVPDRPLYQFRVIPFGLAYLDHLLIIADSFENRIQLLKEVAEYLQKANLTIGLKKSLSCFKELRYLGFIIGNDRLEVMREQIKYNMHQACETSAKRYNEQAR